MSVDGKQQRSFTGRALALVVVVTIAVTLLVGTAVFLIVKLSNENAQLRGEQTISTSDSEPATVDADAQRINENKIASFKRAFETCAPSENPQFDVLEHLGTAELVDGGRTIRLDGDRPNDYGLTINSCLLENLRAPQSVRAKYDGTKALDGVRSDAWNDITAEWTFSPTNGLNAVYELNLD